MGRAYLDFWCLFREWLENNMHHWCSQWRSRVTPAPSRRKRIRRAQGTRDAGDLIDSARGIGEAGDFIDIAHAHRINNVPGTIECVLLGVTLVRASAWPRFLRSEMHSLMHGGSCKFTYAPWANEGATISGGYVARRWGANVLSRVLVPQASTWNR